jgi:hypothetical protein
MLAIGCQTETKVTLTAFAKESEKVANSKALSLHVDNFRLPSFLHFKHRNCAYLRYW